MSVQNEIIPRNQGNNCVGSFHSFQLEDLVNKLVYRSTHTKNLRLKRVYMALVRDITYRVSAYI